MPRDDSFIRFQVKAAGTDNFANYHTEPGTTLREMIENEFGANPAKFRVLVNGAPADSLAKMVNNGDTIVLEPLNYSSAA